MFELKAVTPEIVSQFFLSDPKLVCLGLPDDEMTTLFQTGQYPCEDTNIAGVYENDRLIALHKFEYFTAHAINVHFYLNSELHGTDKLGQIFYFMKNHLEQNTNLMKVLFMVPSSCIHVQKAAEKFGLVKEGHITNVFVWRQEPCDIIIYGHDLERGEV